MRPWLLPRAWGRLVLQKIPREQDPKGPTRFTTSLCSEGTAALEEHSLHQTPPSAMGSQPERPSTRKQPLGARGGTRVCRVTLREPQTEHGGQAIRRVGD